MLVLGIDCEQLLKLLRRHFGDRAHFSTCCRDGFQLGFCGLLVVLPNGAFRYWQSLLQMCGQLPGPKALGRERLAWICLVARICLEGRFQWPGFAQRGVPSGLDLPNGSLEWLFWEAEVLQSVCSHGLTPPSRQFLATGNPSLSKHRGAFL